MIPKIIHYCWFGGKPFPPLVEMCINSWKKNLPDYEFVLWDENKIDINSCPWLFQCIQNKKYAFAADYTRCYALFHYGGIYLDTDVEVIKNFDNLLFNKSFIGFDSSGSMESAIIGSEKGTKWIKDMLDYYNTRSFIKKENNQLDMKPIPGIIYDVLEKYSYFENKNNNSLLDYDDICIYPCDFFSPKNYHTRKIKLSLNTYTIHHFDGSWVDRTVYSRFRQGIHNLLYSLLGENTHNKIVKNIRRLKKNK